MYKLIGHIVDALRKEFRLLSSIGIGVFFFILFFEPFPIERFDFNNRLLFIAGLAIIVFLFMASIHIGVSCYTARVERSDKLELPAYFEHSLSVALSTVAMTFYLRYVGSTAISFLIVFQILLICMITQVVLWLFIRFNELKQINKQLLKANKLATEKLNKYENANLNRTIEFVSEDRSENLHLAVSTIVHLQAADNYVEIIFKKGDEFQRVMIRNTLKNVEFQLKLYPDFVRCHRSCIVNIKHVDKLLRNDNKYWLLLIGIEKPIPVSRQYKLKVKELL